MTATSFPEYVTDITISNAEELLIEGDTIAALAFLKNIKFTNIVTLTLLPRSMARDNHECGVPEEISVDGGTNLVSAEMRAFLDRWGVAIRQSSAGYPQSNGRAEAAVKSAKAILRTSTSASGIDSDKAIEALIQYHNTPLRDGGKSPAQLLMGRQLRGGVPVPLLNHPDDDLTPTRNVGTMTVGALSQAPDRRVRYSPASTRSVRSFTSCDTDSGRSSVNVCLLPLTVHSPVEELQGQTHRGSMQIPGYCSVTRPRAARGRPDDRRRHQRSNSGTSDSEERRRPLPGYPMNRRKDPRIQRLARDPRWARGEYLSEMQF
ncbi:hypothetical protein FJT64_022603 [Amphibalanus amphitrite]|uniref:Integrase catalytic domain-containing protein n=1 Tax=Amphibalanus amphitrite TaxID=1232801 RepID=A0A6A4WT60_AMPAM|nr:hypothetical protein FJT64_022603 [Amphibalanus amphitrite]